MEWLEGCTSGTCSAGQSDVEANVSGLNLHMRRKDQWTDRNNLEEKIAIQEREPHRLLWKLQAFCLLQGHVQYMIQDQCCSILCVNKGIYELVKFT